MCSHWWSPILWRTKSIRQFGGALISRSLIEKRSGSMKLTTIASLVVFLLCTITTNAQTQGLEIDNGFARELKGVQKVFIDANANEKKTIFALIKQKLPQLTMVVTPATADVCISFSVETA